METRERKRWLRQKRKQLGWPYEEMSRRIRCTVDEYQQFELGKVTRCNGLGFLEIKHYLEDHLLAMEK